MMSPLSEVDTLMKHFFGDALYSSENQRGFSPPANIGESETAYEISVELPGVSPESVNIEFQDGSLKISGEKKLDDVAEGWRRVYSQRIGGKFSRSFDFSSEVDVEKIEATFNLGVLHVRIPKAEKAVPRKIEVKAGEN
jgi:HSP20 family protein